MEWHIYDKNDYQIFLWKQNEVRPFDKEKKILIIKRHMDSIKEELLEIDYKNV